MRKDFPEPQSKDLACNQEKAENSRYHFFEHGQFNFLVKQPAGDGLEETAHVALFSRLV